MYNFYPKKNGYQPQRGYLHKLLLIMKLTTIILITVILHVSASSLAQKVTLAEKNAQLVDVFGHIRSQTGYDFVFAGSDLQGLKTVTINVKNEELSTVLQKIFEGQPLQFSIEDKLVVVEEKKESLLDKAKALFAQVAISGKVQDETGQPMVGVTITIKGTNRATATDKNGAFTLTVPDDNTAVIFTFIGYEPQELRAKDIPAGAVITLKATAQNLKEVVVNKGYYQVREELNTGSTSRVTGEDINKQPVSDPIMALEGRVPGLFISQGSGIPGANLNVQIRGRNSISSGNNPLYIVDGVPYTSTTLTASSIGGGALGFSSNNTNSNTRYGMSPFNSLNPGDIEDIEILKDADATAIYGSRGANGVILITTRKGKAGVTKVDANIYSGIGEVTRELPLLNTEQYLQMRREGYKNDGVPIPNIATSPTDKNYDINGTWDTNRYTDWQKVLIGNTAHFTNAQVSLSGGTANTQFLLGGGYSKQTTVFPGNYFDEKASAHISLNHNSTNQKFHTTFSAQFVHGNNQVPNTDFTSQILLAPDAPAIYDANGNINWEKGTWNNPLAQTFAKATAGTDNLIGNLNLAYEILPGLKLQSSFGYTHLQMNQVILLPATLRYGTPTPNSRTNFNALNNASTWIIEPQLNYSKKIGEGKLDVLIGTTWQENNSNSVGVFAGGFSSDALISNAALASTVSFSGSNYSDYKYNALYGRIGYNWADKYLLNLTARRDGSSRFGPNNKFGNFGAVGAGWIFSKEKLIGNNLSWLSFGKLRASYGITGNDQIPDYQYLSTYSALSGSSSYQGVTGLTPTRIANPYFGWEVVKKLEGGVDLGFLQDRVLLSIDFYRNRTDNQLIGQTLPSIDGFTTIQENLPALVQNTGWEFSLNTVNLKSESFSWSSSFNLTIPKNELVSYPDLTTSTNKNRYAIGQPLSIQRIFYHYTGVDPQSGIYTFDVSNSLQFSQPVTQKYYGGFQNSFVYKGWQLDVFVQFVKQTGINYISYFNSPGTYGPTPNEPTYVLNHWTTPGNSSGVQKYSQGGNDPITAYGELTQSENLVVDASFVRVKNASLSYSLPTSWQRAAHLRSARVYFQGQNLLTITGYKGLDPEAQGLTLPPLRMATIGVQLGL